MKRLDTVTAEADLYARMRRCAEIKLGPGADKAAIDKLADQYYWDDDPNSREETPEEIRLREAESAREMQRIKDQGGVPW